MIDFKLFFKDCIAVRTQSPLVLNITNDVAMNFTANALLAVGASPLMSCSIDEIAELVHLSDSMVLNIGCIDRIQAECMRLAAATAGSCSKRWVLDPVGAGASRLRTETALSLMEEFHPAVVRGNAAEILSLAGCKIHSHGVDAEMHGGCADPTIAPAQHISNFEEIKGIAGKVAEKYGCVVSVSGPVDIITDGKRFGTIANGSPMMTRVTAMGCAASALTAAFLSVEEDSFAAALEAMAMMGIAGEKASAVCKGTGSLAVDFIDELSNFEPQKAAAEIRQ